MSTHLTAGAIIAKRYRLEKQLGEGGMGTVWSATHTVTRKRVALKFLKPRAMSQHHRFLREARAACAVEHPHVVAVHDIFELDDGMPVMVMELFEGESLAALLTRKQQLTVAELAHVLLPVVSAVGTAHAAGIIHRDLKPENIFLARSGDGPPVVKVLDFGIAKLVSNELGPPAPGDTQTGALLGTPNYMSPEQAAGERVDHRTDIWSLGIIAYQALSGVLPTRADSVGGVLKIVMMARIEPLSTRGLVLPEDVVALVDRMLAEKQADRPHDLREAKAVLERHVGAEVLDFGAPRPERALDTSDVDTAAFVETAALGGAATMAIADTVAATAVGTPGHSTTAGLAQTAQTTVAPKRAWPFIAAVIVVGGVVGSWWWTTERAVAEQGVVATPARAALVEPELGLGALAVFRDRPADEAQSVSSPAFWEAAARDFEGALEQKNAPVRWGAARDFANGMALLQRGKLDEARQAFVASSERDASWALPHSGLAATLVLLGKTDDAVKAAQDAQRLEPDWWGGPAASANVYVKQNKLDDAIVEYRRALRMSQGNAFLLASLALTYHAARIDAEAERYAQLALAVDDDLVDVRIMLAERALEKRDGAAALAEATRAVGTAPRDLAARLAFADALALLGRRDEAMAAYRETLRIKSETGALGAPEDRLALVAQSLERDELPPPRVSEAPTPRAGAQPASRSRPPASSPRSRPPKPTSPNRSRSCGCAPNDLLCAARCAN